MEKKVTKEEVEHGTSKTRDEACKAAIKAFD